MFVKKKILVSIFVCSLLGALNLQANGQPKAEGRGLIAETSSLLAPRHRATCFLASTSFLVSQRELAGLLQKGGHIIYFRHPQTNPHQADIDTLHLANIKAQRQLTAIGENQATQIGKAFRILKIPVGQVFVSQYYRDQKTARLAGFKNFQTSVDVTEPQNQPPLEINRRAVALRRMLSTQPKKGTNTVIIAHRPNLEEAAGKTFGDFQEGEAAIFEPTEAQGFKLVARVASPERWMDLASAFTVAKN